MEKLKALSLSSLNDKDKPDPPLSNSNSNDTESVNKYAALMDELHEKTGDFITDICTTKTVASKNVLHQAGKIHVKPLSPAAYDKIDDFINSIDNVIKWHEAQGKQYQDAINFLVKGMTFASEETDTNIKELKRVIAEHLETITELKQSLAAAEDEKQDAFVHVADMNEQNESLKTLLTTAEFELGTMKSIVAGNDDNITHWKQMFEESYRLSRAQSDELNRKIVDLQVQLQTAIAKDAGEIEASKKTISDLKKQLTDSTFDFSEKIKALEEEIAELKKADLQKNVTITANEDEKENFIELKDVVVDGKIDYEKLNGKISGVNKVSVLGDCYYVRYKDGIKEKRIEIKLNGSFKLRLHGTFLCTANNNMHKFYQYVDSSINVLCKHIDSCVLTTFSLNSGSIYLNDLLTLVGSQTVEDLCFGGYVKYANGDNVPLENILEYFPNLKTLSIFFPELIKASTCSKKTIAKLPTFRNLEKFEIRYCPYDFDLESFGKFMKKHSCVQFVISFAHFHRHLPQHFIEKLDRDRNAILRSWPRNAPKPNIIFF